MATLTNNQTMTSAKLFTFYVVITSINILDLRPDRIAQSSPSKSISKCTCVVRFPSEFSSHFLLCAVMALVRLCVSVESPEPSIVTYVNSATSI